jgi:hypothetical protein
MNFIRKNDRKAKILRGNPPMEEEKVWDNDCNEEKVWESLKWCSIWASAVFIICCFLR